MLLTRLFDAGDDLDSPKVVVVVIVLVGLGVLLVSGVPGNGGSSCSVLGGLEVAGGQYRDDLGLCGHSRFDFLLCPTCPQELQTGGGSLYPVFRGSFIGVSCLCAVDRGSFIGSGCFAF